MIYGAFIIPVLATILLLVFYRKDTKWWEIAVPFIACAIIVPIAIVTAKGFKTRDIGWKGNITKEAVHDEPYDYMSTCYRTVSCGKNCTTTVSYPCVQQVSRACWLQTKWGGNQHISYAKYNELLGRWGGTAKQKFKDMNRSYHSYDGDRYIMPWNGSKMLAESIVSQYTWKNKVQASDDVHNFREITPEDAKKFKLYDYPKLSGYEQVTILDKGKNHSKKPWGFYWRYVNGEVGALKNARFWVLIFRGKSLETARLQEDYWKGGNENEFIYMIGVDKDDNVTWAHITSWTERTQFKIEARNYASTMGKLDLMALAKWTEENARKQYVALDFQKKFDYLTVQPSGTSVVISYLIVLLITMGICVWAVKNSYHDHGYGNRNHYMPKKPKRRSGRSRYRR